MIKHHKRFNVLRKRFPGEMCLAFAGYGQGSDPGRRISPASGAVAAFPRRPDASVINEAIPLFYIGQNENGLWVAREAEGRSGGLFLRKQSALHFARKRSEPAGCATMFLNEPFELDIENRGSRIAALLATVSNVAERRAPTLIAFVRSMVAEWRKLITQISRACAAERRHRGALETELFRGQYTLSSKSDDDLPIP